MPKNYAALERYRIIDRCLKNGGRWNWESLSEEIFHELYKETNMKQPPSRRTIMLDIANMKSGRLGYVAPIEFDRKEGSYFYDDKKFSITNTPLSRELVEQLVELKDIIRSYRGFKGFQGIEEVTAQLDHILDRQQRKLSAAYPIIMLNESQEYTGLEHLDHIMKSIRQRQTMTIRYKPFDKEEMTIKIFPYMVKQFNNRWFLFGYNEQEDAIHIYALDRILDINISLKQIENPPEFNPYEHFRHIFGVTLNQDEPITEVRFSVKKPRAFYIETKPLHINQKKTQETDEFIEFSVRLIPNKELESELLSYGSDIQILAPQSLREKFVDYLKDALQQYQ